MKKAVLLLCLLLALSGCGRDAASLTVVTGLSVDGVPGNYSVCAEVIRLTEGETDEHSVVLKASGPTVTEGIEQMAAMTGRSLYCNHVQVLVIGRETAERGIAPLIRELIAGTQYPGSLRLAVAEGSAEAVLKSSAVVSSLHSTEMRDAIRENADRCISPDVQICGFYEQYLQEGIEGILPVIGLKNTDDEPTGTIRGTAVFLGDRLAMMLDERESACLCWLRGQSGGTLSVGNTVFKVKHTRSALRASPAAAALELSFSWNIKNQEAYPQNALPELEQTIANDCSALLQKLKMQGCDAVGLGEALRRSSPKDWKRVKQNWPAVFRSYPVTVRIRTDKRIPGRVVSGSGEPREENHDGG